MLFSHPREFKSLFSCSFTEIHRDFLHRPSTGYLPEEIWRKAGKSIWTVYCRLSPTSTWAQTFAHWPAGPRSRTYARPGAGKPVECRYC